MTVLATTSYFHEVARRGDEFGEAIEEKFGRNSDIGTTREDVWDAGAIWPEFDSADTLEITSDSTSDDAGEIGALTVKVWGLQATTFALISETVTMNGTANVQTINEYEFVYRMRVITSGTNETNVGDITASHSGTSTVHAQISAGDGQTGMAVYMVPGGKTGRLIGWGGTVNSGNAAAKHVDVRLMVKEFGESWVAKDFFGINTTGNSNYWRDSPGGIAVPEKGLIKMDAESSAVLTDVSARFHVWLIDD